MFFLGGFGADPGYRVRLTGQPVNQGWSHNQNNQGEQFKRHYHNLVGFMQSVHTL